MRIFSSTGRRVSVLVLALAIAVMPAAKVFADFAPQRATFTWAHPATYITFDSITDNPSVGDERPFLSGKLTNASGNVVDTI
jgi:hypothetical protein